MNPCLLYTSHPGHNEEVDDGADKGTKINAIFCARNGDGKPCHLGTLTTGDAVSYTHLHSQRTGTAFAPLAPLDDSVEWAANDVMVQRLGVKSEA